MTAKINKNAKFLLKYEFARTSMVMVIATVLADICFGEILPQSSVSKRG